MKQEEKATDQKFRKIFLSNPFPAILNERIIFNVVNNKQIWKRYKLEL